MCVTSTSNIDAIYHVNIGLIFLNKMQELLTFEK